MLVVKRSFRNYGKMLPVGFVISDPAGVKRLKSRISDHDVVIVTEHNYEQYRAYFLAKCNVELPTLTITVPEEPKVKEPKVEEPKVEVQKKATAKAATAKATTAKAVAK